MMQATLQEKLKEGSVLGGILLVAGSCIGAGMLALPVITGVSGFFPSVVMFFFAWFFMTATGLLLLEANLSVGHELSLITIAQKTLGKPGKLLCWVLFVFLFYSLSVAYIAASGQILHQIALDLFGISIAEWIGSLLFTIVFGFVVYLGTREVDYFNRVLMFGLIISYFLLILLGSLHIQLDNLLVHNWEYAFAAVPILIISFGFHNMIPSLAMYLKGDVVRLRTTVIIGSLIPLIVYLLWEAVMLGIIPVEGRGGLLHALDKGEAATAALRAVVGQSWVNTVAQSFALFAIITSFLAQSLSLVDFLSDGLNISKVRMGRVILIALTLIPPFIFAFLYPGVFIEALNLAGGFSAVILFGVMPALMVWSLRYRKKVHTEKMIPYGKPFLILIMVVALSIFFYEMAHEFGLDITKLRAL